ncbi:MAG: hypothetical protein LBK13_07070 [Spirochaetales bacterium]|jgi:TolB-like protein|nr:hypothetical protein [Spirochaetales bacterium]
MKKILLIGAVLLWALAGCLSSNFNAVPLGEAIELSAQEIETVLPDGVKIAVLSFKSDSGRLSDYVIEELMGNLVKGRKVVVVDRNSLDLVRQEWNFQSSGEVSDDSAQSIGKMLGAQAVVSGNLMDLGNAYRFRIYSLNVETAAREASAMFTVYRDDQIAYLLNSGQDAARPAAPQKSIAEGRWAGTRDWDFEELADFTVTISGNEGILQYYGDDGISGDESWNFAKGTIAVTGNSVTGTLTHFWGNALDGELGRYWIPAREFFIKIGEDDSELASLFSGWKAEINENILTVTPPRGVIDDASNTRWTFIKQ